MSTVLHIGFHKTGTTTLQRNVFPRIEGSAYVGPTGPLAPLFRGLAETVWAADDDAFRPASLRGLFADVRGDAPALVVSHESFSRYVYDERIPSRLLDLMPDARVLVCVRNQRTMVRSLYHQYLVKGGYERFEDWIRSEKLHPNYVQYDITLEHYQNVFGAERVRAVAYEDLKERPDQFVAEIMRYVRPEAPVPTIDLGSRPENTSLSDPTRAVLRHVNRLFVRSNHNPEPVLFAVPSPNRIYDAARVVDGTVLARTRPSRKASEEEEIERLVPVWAKSNARLQEQTGLPLDDLGYPLP
jgi:hypothetical protein